MVPHNGSCEGRSVDAVAWANQAICSLGPREPLGSHGKKRAPLYVEPRFERRCPLAR